MKSKIIIGIHGLGNKPSKEILENWWATSIAEGLINAGYTEKLPDFKLVYWADLLYDKPRDSSVVNKKSPYYLQEKYVPSFGLNISKDYKLRKKIIDFLKTSIDKIFLRNDFSTNYNYISNAIIHLYFKDLETYYGESFREQKHPAYKIRQNIRIRLAEELKKHSHREIMLIAHSMGSIVAFDVLSLLIPEIPIDTFVSIGSPLGLPIVRSKIAIENNFSKTNRATIPIPPGINKNWYNLADLEDKVALHYDLKNDYHENENGVKIIDYLVKNDYFYEHIRNPHNSFGYLRTPEMSQIVIDFITRKEKIWLQKLLKNTKDKINTVLKKDT